MLKFYYLCVFIILNSEVVDTDIKCNKQTDCYDPTTNIRCSYCVEDESKEGHCIFPYKDMFELNTKCTLQPKCKYKCINSCSNIHKSTLFYPYCVPLSTSTADYSSDQCKEFASRQITEIKYLVLRFDEVRAADYKTFHFYILGANGAKCDDVELLVKFGDEDYKMHLPPKPSMQFNCDEPLLHYNIKATFPYKPPTSKDVKTLGDVVVGYESTILANAYFKKRLIYEKTFPVFVRYDGGNLKCVPTIRLLNCGTTLEKSVKFIRPSTIVVKSQVTFMSNGQYLSRSVNDPDCDRTRNSRISWKLWSSTIIKGQFSFIPQYENYDLKDVLFYPYKLSTGHYKVTFEVTNVVVDATTSNVQKCYFNVICLPLMAIINGGSDRQIYKESGLVLTADKSTDPNMPVNQQTHLFIEWSCVKVKNPTDKPKMCEPKTFAVFQPYYISGNSLEYGAVYNFTLKVWTNHYTTNKDCTNVSPKLAHLRIEVANTTGNLLQSINIECVRNCQGKVLNNQLLYMKAITTNLTEASDIKWSYYKEEDTEKPVDIKLENTPSYILIIKPNSLEAGTSYTIVVREGEVGLYAKYSFETDKLEYIGNCSVNPDSGVKGKTLFDISCDLNGNIYLFEFFDKSDQETEDSRVFSGRMLGSSNDGELTDIQLTRGNLIIYVKNKYGLSYMKKVIVTLTYWELRPELMSELKTNLTNVINRGYLSGSLRYISLIPDIVPHSMDNMKNDILNMLLSAMSQLNKNIKQLGDIKLSTSTLTNVLLTLNKPKHLQLTSDLMLNTMKIILGQAKTFCDNTYDGQSLSMSRDEMIEVLKSILGCLSAALTCRNPKTEKAREDDFDMITLYDLRRTSRSIERSLAYVNKVLSYLQSPGQPPSKVASDDNNIIMWTMETDQRYSIPEMLERNQEIPVGVSNELQKKLNKLLSKTEHIALQVGSLQQNIFWWSTSEIKSNLISVSLVKEDEKHNMYPIQNIDPYMDISLKMAPNLTSVIITGSTTQLDINNLTPLSLDLRLPVHRLDPAPWSLVRLKFLFPETNASLRVLSVMDFRPDYEMMNKSKAISEKSPFYNIEINQSDEPKFVFIAILPGTEVPVNYSVSYSFQVNTTLCQYWASGQWSSLGCKIASVIGDSEVHCHCSHLSIFAAAFPVPPEEIDPFKDAKLFLTVFNNPLVVAFVSAILLLYLLLCIWVWRLDKLARNRRTVIVLEDNFLTDTFPYLVAVYTSSRFNAGTTANVALRIIGSSANSRVHVLSCKGRSILQRNSDDWFLICCHEHLGKLESIHVWHDNSGYSPDWFCNKIYIYDIKERTATFFFLRQWLALRLNEFPEAFMLSASTDEEELMDVKDLFLENCVLGLRENHVLLGCIMCHPRSGISKVERLSVFMCCMMLAMLCSIMFYNTGDKNKLVDDYHYEIGSRELYISLQSTVISVVITCFVFFSFQKSYKYPNEKQPDLDNYRDSISRGYKLRMGSKVRSFYENYVLLVTKMVKDHPMEPVRLPSSQPVLKVRKTWRIIAWVSCTAVIVCSSYMIMLYGLKLGYVKSQKWLTTLLMSMGTEIFILGPARIIFMSSLLTVAFKNMFDVETHQVSIADVRELDFPDDVAVIEALIRRRCQDMYAPLTINRKQAMLRKQQVRSNWWSLIDFVNAIFLALVLSSIIFRLWSSHYYTNSHVVKIMATLPKYRIGSVSFYEVTNKNKMEDYVENTFTNAIYNLRWYNGQKILQENTTRTRYWAADYTLRMLGLPLLRQLRTVPVSCKNLAHQTNKCLPHWSRYSEDTDDYGVGWTPGKWTDEGRSNSPWKYTDVSDKFLFMDIPYGSSTTLYKHGGYTVALGPKRQDTDVMVAELKDNHWLDWRTSVVFVELTFFNVNKGLFTKVTMTAEYLISGNVLKKAEAKTVEGTLKPSYFSVLFILLLLYYIARIGYLINRQGLLEYLSYVRNICQLLIVIFGLLAIGIFCVHYYTCLRYVEEFHRSGQENYFDFDSFIFYFKKLQILLSILLSVAILLVVVLLRFGRYLLTHYYTFTLSINWILWLTFLIAILTIIFKHLANLFNIFISFTLKTIIINKNSINDIIMNDDFLCTNVRIFLVFKTVAVSFLLFLFVVCFTYYAKIARSYKLISSDEFNYFSFLQTQLKMKHKTR